MIILPNTTDKIQLVTGQAGTINVVASYGECSQATPPVVAPFGRQLTSITTATTTDILGAPGASTTRTPEEITICNADAAATTDVTVQYNANATIYKIYKATLRPGEVLEYIKGIGWFVLSTGVRQLANASTADLTTAAGTDTYLTNSNLAIPINRPIGIGTMFRWRVFGSKTAAGTAAWTVNVRFGTAASTSDTARLALAQVTDVQTAVVDNGVWDVFCIVRGPISSSCIVSGGLSFSHHLATTGLSTVSGTDVYQATSSAFDITTVTQVGLSINPGASGVFTFQVVSAESLGL